MSAIIWAQPKVTTTPPPKLTAKPEYTYLWHGVDGSVWDLADWRAGVYLQSGLVGMGHAGIDRWTQQSPALAGNLFGGTRVQELPVQWPLVIATRVSGEWKDLVRRWWASWSTDVAGTWEVIDSTGRSLSLDLRHNPQAGFSLDVDPGLYPWVPWTLDAVADSPYWRGETVTQSWGSGGTPQPFFDTATGMLPLHIMLASNFNSATLSNPGTVPVSPVFTVTGPLDAFTIKVGTQQFAGPVVASGDSIRIDTSPTNPDAIKNGATSVVRQFTSWGAPVIPPGQTVPIEITTAGSGTVAAELTPLYKIGF